MRVPRTHFLAVPLEGDTLAAAGAMLNRLAATVAGVQWVRPEGLHVTVTFLGPLEDPARASIVAAVAPVAATTPAFALRPRGLDAFPDSGSPHVLWLALGDGAEPLAALAAASGTALAPLGYAAEARPYRPHCTIGRVRRPWSHEQRAAWRSLAAPDLPAQMARRLVLFESLPERRGSRYVPVAELALGG